jgi:hypothetical protein
MPPLRMQGALGSSLSGATPFRVKAGAQAAPQRSSLRVLLWTKSSSPALHGKQHPSGEILGGRCRRRSDIFHG